MRPAARGEGEKSSKTEDSDTKFRIIRRLNLLVSQPSIYMRVYVWGGGNMQYTIVMVEVSTQEYDYNISYIV
jgi:hypothetical protein